jgi:hypothetical protein
MTPTPLLDRLAPLPAPVAPGRGSRIVFWVSVAMTAAVVVTISNVKPSLWRDTAAALQARFPDVFDAPWTVARIVVAVASIAVATVAVVVLHECGHLAGGLLAGFRFNTMAIGPLKVDDRFRLSIHRGTLAWSGGWVAMFPAAPDRLRWRAIALVAAGPLTCIGVGTAGLLAGAIAGPGSAVFIVGCLLSALDLLPVRAGAVTWDGWRIVSLLRNDVWARRWLALITVAAEFRSGVAPDELPRPVIEDLVAVEDESVDTPIAHAVAYSASFFSGDNDRSARLLETSLRFSGHAPAPFRMALMSDAAAFQGRRRHRPDLALAWKNDLPAEAPAWLRARSEAAVLQAQGQTAAAAEKLDECEKAIGTLPMPSEEQRRMAIRLLGRWKAELAEMTASLPTKAARKPSVT